jgi:hypothetical protein
MAENQIDLLTFFNTVSSVLSDNKVKLNNADTYNHDHGDHMVDVFNLITNAVGQKKGAPVGDQLKFAGEQLLQNPKSGSAAMYGENLLQAAKAFKGKQISADNGIQLAQMLLGAQQTTPQSSGVLGSLLSSFTAGGTSDGLDAGDFLTAGMAFFQSKQAGDTNLEAAMDALVAATTAGQTPHRAESGKLIASTLLQLLTSSKK